MFIYFDCDNTLFPDAARWMLADARCTVEILQHIGGLAPFDIAGLLQHQGELENRLIDVRGYNPTRYAETWTVIYVTLCGEIGVAPDDDVLNHIQAHASQVSRRPFGQPFEGVLEILQTLQLLSHHLNVVTLGNKDVQLDKLDDLGLLECFSRDGIHVFPRTKEEFLQAQAQKGLSLMVGDSMRHDILPALRAGMYAALFQGRRNGGRAEIDQRVGEAGLDSTMLFTISSMRELLPIVGLLTQPVK